jgi:lipopolysaccharide export system permease protein
MRLAGPISGLSMALLPILCLLPGEFNRRGQSRRVTLAIALAFLFEFVDLGLRDVAGRMNGAMLVLYLNMMLPLVATAWFLWRDVHPPAAAPAAARQAV